MNILAFDACFSACSVAAGVMNGATAARIESLYETRESGHADALMPMIAAVLRQAGLRAQDLDRIAVTRGPGGFSGVRIGVAAARAFSLATGAPAVSASSLAVMAEQVCEDLELPGDAALLVAVDARRGQVYAQLFGSGGMDARSPPLLLSVAEAAALDGGPLIIVGSGAEPVAAAANREGRSAAAAYPNLAPDASRLFRMAPRLALERRPIQPLYLREPDAKAPASQSIART